MYAIGDIHGERKLLEALIAELPLREADRLVFLGDYVDRGPDAHGVVEYLIELAHMRPCVFLCGNHESMFLDFLGWQRDEYFAGDAFLANGGDRTLASYGYFDVPDPDPSHFELPRAHRDFFRNLKLYHREGDYLFVHAGVGRRILREKDLGYALRKVESEDLLWDRSSIDQPHDLDGARRLDLEAVSRFFLAAGNQRDR